MNRADRVRRLAHDVYQYIDEHGHLPPGPETPTLSQYIAERVVEEEVARARMTGQVPAWATEPRT